MKNFMKQFTNRDYLIKIFSFILFVSLWEIASRFYISIVLPSPLEVFEGFFKLCYKEGFV